MKNLQLMKSILLKRDNDLRLFEMQMTRYTIKRKIIVQNITNLQKQLILLQASYLQSLEPEKKMWQLDRSKCFWEVDCQENGDNFFKENFRMSRDTFKVLCSLLSSFGKDEKSVAIALYSLGSSASYRTVANLFGVRTSAVTKILHQFCVLVWSKLKSEYISDFPLTLEKIEECVNGFHAIGFPQCLGAIDGCHIEIHPRASVAEDYFNSKGWYSTVLLALVDYRCRFMYINVGSPGRFNDATIFKDSNLKKTLDQCPLIPQMSKNINGVEVPIVIIGDSAFRFSKNLMKPYPYHCEQDRMQINFNNGLSKCRKVVENAFGHLKVRFRRIDKGLDNRIDNTNSIIKACCILHNFLNEKHDTINNNWLVDQLNCEKKEQPTKITLLGNINPSAEEIRRTIAGSLCITSEDE